MRRLVGTAAALLVLGTGCATADPSGGAPPVGNGQLDQPWQRGDEPWRGILVTDDSSPARVSIDGTPALPAAAAGYRWVPPTEADLRALAERHAGGSVDEAAIPGGSPDLVSFDAGDGWFWASSDTLGAALEPPGLARWSWMDRAAREHPPVVNFDRMKPCPAGTAVPPEAIEFFRPLGVDLVANGRLDCDAGAVWVRLDVVIDGLPVVGLTATALVLDGRVIDASGPFVELQPLGDLELAPAGEVVRRLASGPGLIPEDPSCGEEPCDFTTAEAALALAIVSTGGIGGHDHTVGNVVPGPDVSLLVPVLRATSTTDLPVNVGIPHRSAVALSSALLVDDPEEADAARRADEVAADQLVDADRSFGCEGDALALLVCSSSFTVVVGDPVVITVSAEVHGPVGATACAPLLEVDFGDGTTATAPPPRSGTLVSARTVHVFREPGVFTVEAHRASRCEVAQPGGGSEPPYDETESLQVTVTS